MHKLLFILLCLTGLAAQAVGPRTFYVSNAGNNSNNGLTPATSWLSLSQVNATAFTNGDSVLFKRGDIFYGSLTNVGTGVTFADYGTGVKPTISGFVTIAGWTNLGSNLYEALVPNGLSTVNMVVNANGRTIPMGRYPNANTTNGGYLTYENAHNAVPDIVDAQLPNLPDWTGADIVLRKQDYAITRNQVTNHVDSTVTINQLGQFVFRVGNRALGESYGYFFENSPQTLDQNGEWYYNPTTTKIKMYYTGTPPTIQVATVDVLINFPLAQKANVSIRNLRLTGSESDLMYISYMDNLLIDSCDFSYAGGSGFQHRNDTLLTVQNCTFTDINMLGMHEVNPGGDNQVVVQKNKFKRIGIWPGMLVKNHLNYHEGASHSAISAGCNDLMIRNNEIDSVGYCGIIIPKSREREFVRQNIISNYCFLKNDGGAIYNSGIRTDPASVTPLYIDSNVVFSSGDASNGTGIPDDPHTRAIYLDASSTNVQILNNTLYDSYEGIYISQASRVTIRNNTIYGGGRFVYQTIPGAYARVAGAININNTLSGYQHTANNIITRNTIFSDAPNKPFIYQADRYSETATVGIIDSNTYVSPMGDFPGYLVNTTDASSPARSSFEEWQSSTPYDTHSTLHTTRIPARTVVTTGVNKSLNSNFAANVNNTSTSAPGTLVWDSTGKITGAGSAKLSTTTISSTGYTQLLQVVGPIDVAKTYVLRFKTVSNKIGNLQTYLAQRTGSYNIITTAQFGAVSTTVQQQEFIFSGQHSTETSAGVYINFSQNNNTVYIDDIEFYEVSSVTANPMSNYVLFSVNKTATPVTIGLGGFSYNTLANVNINTSTNVPAFGSTLLFKGNAFLAPIYLKPIKLPFSLRRS